MNSSPPPPSFTLPPLPSSGQFPITPSPTPSPTAEKPGLDLKGKSKAREAHDDVDGGRVSMYVWLFDEMIRTVLETEKYLFTPRESWVLRRILELPYEPHYLLTRLLLRRPGRILPSSNLVIAYSAELGEEGVKRGMRALSRNFDVPADLTEDDHHELPLAGPSDERNTPPSPGATRTPSSPRKRKCPWSDLPTGLTPAEEKADPQLAEAIRESLWASKVGRVELDNDGSVVHSPPPERPSASRSGSDSSASSFSSISPARVRYDEEFSLSPRHPHPITALARDESNLGLAELMSSIPADDLRKVARARKIPLSMLATREAVVTALKGVAKKQTVLGFTPVKGGARQTSLPFRASKITSISLLVAQLLPYLGDAAIQLTPELHALIARVNLIFSRTPPLTSTSSSLMLPSILVTSHKRRYPDYGPPTRSRIWETRDQLLEWERAVGWEALVADALGDTWAEQRKIPLPGFGVRKEMLGRAKGAKVVKRVWEGVWPIWLGLVDGDGGREVDARAQQGGLVGDRFKTGHVLTRIVYKGATALGILHEYDLECQVLRSLLEQRRWRRGKRGAWYERLALVLMYHYNATPIEKEEKMREAVQVCIDGLLDEDTHLIYRPALSRRLTRLENKLVLPSDERHISHAELLKCETRELSAPRVPENAGQPKPRPRGESRDREREASLGMGDGDGNGDVASRGGVQQVGKSVWVGREGEVTVEGWVLEWWEGRGYKGFHSEGSIVTTLFGLLMWPILFAPLPGAFETPYQIAPLDLGEDTFAPARAEILESRLLAMCKTSTALEMLQEADERERGRGTWAVGVNWEYGQEDLEEILECVGGKAISGVCRMLGEEYRHRVSGVPDLIVWSKEKGEVRFVEVKGPGDSLSETQKVWVDVLLSAGVQVEVCRVKAKDVASSTKKRSSPMKERQGLGRDGTRGDSMKVEDDAGHGREDGDGRVERDENGDEEGDGEWKYEGGDEGKAEGYWEREGKRLKVR